MPRVSLVVSVLAIIVMCACAAPPSKEMNQAQGAIDAAKAAGAEAFAPAELTAAVDAATKALQDARTALNNDDYAGAKKTMEGVGARIQTAISAIDDVPDTQPARRRR